jgi:RNA polymerase sigma factor (TIGR02999 family)
MYKEAGKKQDAKPGLTRRDVEPVTRWLHSASEGNAAALDQLYKAVYPVLYRMAARRPGVQRNATITPTVVINELFLKFADSAVLKSTDRAHFYATCARAMRYILVDFARASKALKRGGEEENLPLVTAMAEQPDRVQELLDIHAALDDLEGVDQRLRELVELKFFGGLNYTEIGELQSRSERSIKRDWVRARAILIARSRQLRQG